MKAKLDIHLKKGHIISNYYEDGYLGYVSNNHALRFSIISKIDKNKDIIEALDITRNKDRYTFPAINRLLLTLNNEELNLYLLTM